jgi:DNA-binding CsgD family transcriptional regulator
MQLRDTQPEFAAQVSGLVPGEKLLSALNDSKIGVVICDRRMRYKALNETLAEIHNVPIAGHMGHCFQEIIGGLAETVVPLWEIVFSTGQPLPNLEVTGQLPKRSEQGRWIENLFPLRDDRGRVAQVGCFVIETSMPPAPLSSTTVVAGKALAAAGYPLPNPDRSQVAPLSPREREVVRLVAEGKSNKEISSNLAISVRTVETYRARLMLKLNVSSIAELVHYAIRSRLVTI